MLKSISDRYTKNDKRIITSDWELTLKEMRRYQNLCFGNRVGPLVINVMLKMGSFSTYYVPIYFVHNLCNAFPAITMTLKIEGPIITPQKHNSFYMQASELIRKKAYIPLAGDLNIDTLIASYKMHFQSQTLTSYRECEDLALVCGWTGQAQKIEYSLKLVYDFLKRWPEDRFFSEYNGFKNWFSLLEKKAWDTTELQKVAKSELLVHKLSQTPERRLVF